MKEAQAYIKNYKETKFLPTLNFEGDLMVGEEQLAEMLQEYADQQLLLHGVVGQSEQLTCPRCKSTNILNPDKDNDAQCIECAFVWAG